MIEMNGMILGIDFLHYLYYFHYIRKQYNMKDNYEETLKLAKKREANSNLKACASDVFYIYDPKLQKEITEEGKKAIDKYKKLFGDSDECYVKLDSLIKFNKMLHDGKHTREECYLYLSEEKNKLESEFYNKHGFYMNMDYNFLYPEMIVNEDLFNKIKNNKNMECYIEEYLNPNNEKEHSYEEIKGWVQEMNKEGKSIPEIKNYLMEKLSIYQDTEEQLIYEKLINCMINNKKYCDRFTREVYQ